MIKLARETYASMQVQLIVHIEFNVRRPDNLTKDRLFFLATMALISSLDLTIENLVFVWSQFKRRDGLIN